MSETTKKQIFFWYGANDFEIALTLRQWETVFEAKYQAINSLTIDSRQYRSATDYLVDLKNALQVNSLFGSNKMIVLRDFFDKKNEKNITALELVEKFFDNLTPNFFLIFIQNEKPDARSKIYKKLDKLQKASLAEIKEFVLPAGSALTAWVQKRFEAKKNNIDRSVAEKLISLIGNDLWQLESEIDKLVAYCQGRKIIIADVDQMAKGKFNEDIFALSDALARRDKKRALLLMKEQLNAGVAEMYLFSMLVRQFRLLRQVKELVESQKITDKTEIARELRLHPFVVQKSLEQINKFSFEDLREIYQQLLEFESTIKSANVDFKVLFDKFIVDL